MLGLTGHCYEAGTTPFSPFVEMVEQMLREMPWRLREALGDDAPEVARPFPGSAASGATSRSRASWRQSSSGTSCSAPC